MKKIAAILASLSLLATGFAFSASAGSAPANPWTDPSVKLYVMEDFQTKMPQGKDVSTFKGYWSFANATQREAATASAQNGKFVVHSVMDDAIFWTRHAGPVSKDLTKHAQGFGTYIKNNTAQTIGVNLYMTGSNKDKDNCMYYFIGLSGWLVDGKTLQVTEAGVEADHVKVPSGFEGYVLFSMEDYVNGWSEEDIQPAVEPGKYTIDQIGFRYHVGMKTAAENITLDNFFLYGKNMPENRADVQLPAVPTTAIKTQPPTAPPTKKPGVVTTTPVNSDKTEPVVSDGMETSETTPVTDDTDTSITTTLSASSDTTVTVGNKPSDSGGNGWIIWVVIAGVIVLAGGAAAAIFIMKKKKIGPFAPQ